MTSHPTADELHSLVRKRLPKVSIATVYRNLEVLADEGSVLKLDLAGTQRRFDGTVENHYHIRCCKCGKVDDIDVQPLAQIEKTAEKSCNYKILTHRLEFIGICPDCDEKTDHNKQVPNKTNFHTNKEE